MDTTRSTNIITSIVRKGPRSALKDMQPIPFRSFGWGHITTESRKHVKKAYGKSFLHDLGEDKEEGHDQRARIRDCRAPVQMVSRVLQVRTNGTGGIMTHSLITPFSYEILSGVPVDEWLASMYDLGDWNCVTKVRYVGSDGKYHSQGGLILALECWRMGDKVGMLLDEIHLSGDVLQFKKQLQMSTNRFPKCLPLDKPVERNTKDIDPDEFSWCFTGNRPQPGVQNTSCLSDGVVRRRRSDRQPSGRGIYRWSGAQQYNNPAPLACADTLERVRSYLKFARTSGRRGTSQGRNSTSRYEVGEYGQERKLGSATWVFGGGQEEGPRRRGD
ncbi:hypothetical protein EDC04DRAFT_2607247 [Pisolithus marmoratus]|nr:hypothetical protein EDC04DRAFT_2607247 [Pisolithus marmoratus]